MFVAPDNQTDDAKQLLKATNKFTDDLAYYAYFFQCKFRLTEFKETASGHRPFVAEYRLKVAEVTR